MAAGRRPFGGSRWKSPLLVEPGSAQTVFHRLVHRQSWVGCRVVRSCRDAPRRILAALFASADRDDLAIRTTGSRRPSPVVRHDLIVAWNGPVRTHQPAGGRFLGLAAALLRHRRLALPPS